jgi:hypothetical protein
MQREKEEEKVEWQLRNWRLRRGFGGGRLDQDALFGEKADWSTRSCFSLITKISLVDPSDTEDYSKVNKVQYMHNSGVASLIVLDCFTYLNETRFLWCPTPMLEARLNNGQR